MNKMLDATHKSSYFIGMNKLSVKTRAQMLSMLCESASMRSVSRLADVSINTVGKLLIDAGNFCAAFHDDNVRGVQAKRIQCDEIWSFTYGSKRTSKPLRTRLSGQATHGHGRGLKPIPS